MHPPSHRIYRFEPQVPLLYLRQENQTAGLSQMMLSKKIQRIEH